MTYTLYIIIAIVAQAVAGLGGGGGGAERAEGAWVCLVIVILLVIPDSVFICTYVRISNLILWTIITDSLIIQSLLIKF